MKYAEQRSFSSVRVIALAAALCGSLVVTACGGGSDALDAVAKATAKSAYSPFPTTIQPGQSASNLSLSAGETAPRFALTLPVGTTAVKIEAAGGTGSPAVTLSSDPNFGSSNSDMICVNSRTCQWAFAPLTATKTIYIMVGTQSSYSNVTLNTFAGPQPNQVIPLNIGEPMSGLSGPANRVYFTFNVPAGASQVGVALTAGDGNAQLLETESLTDFSAAYTSGTSMMLPIVAGKTYYFFPDSVKGNSSGPVPFNNYTMTGYAQ
ncbi:hypothetical protein [Paraburkholderia pallida]|uniref:Lipoprotein n=1 Tax=Paraburkholderia pallida TaxID=2547399 RepID=A0A4P7CPD8_9BURK|nr:hypothetical protein [Paraburkholderia pallida]QBQ95779.1 hypothetical protein E1956_00395 [Paraburkholderia pallida]